MPFYEFTIPGAPRTLNKGKVAPTTRERMALTKAERDKAHACAIAARNLFGWPQSFEGKTVIHFTVFRVRLLDPLANLPGSLKAYQDGVWRALLPLGDGPGTPYVWTQPVQVKVDRPTDERVVVRLET